MNKVKTFFEKMGAVKHKFKLEFAIDTLQMSGTVSEEINVIIKRGNQKLSTPAGKLRKGKLDFKKHRLVFDEITMFYDTKSNKYLPKQSQIRVVINSESGQRKLAGVIQLDLAQYANENLQFKRQEKQLTKGPEKHQSKLSYEIYMKFLRESHSETAGSMINGLQMGKQKEKLKQKQKQRQKQKQKQKVKQQKKKPNEKERHNNQSEEQKVKRRLELDNLNSGQFQDLSNDAQNQNKQDDPKSKNQKLKNNKPYTVHYDKQLEDKRKRQKEIQRQKQKQKQKQHQKQSEQQQNSLQKVKQVLFQQYERPKTEVYTKQEPVQPSQQVELKHQDTEHQQQTLKKLQKQTDKILKENQKLELKTAELKQRFSQAQKYRVSMQESNFRDTKYDNIGKYQLRIKELQSKIQASKRSKKQNHRNYEELNQKYIQLKNQLDGDRVNASGQLQRIQNQYKLDLQRVKEQIKSVKSGVDKKQRQYKAVSKQVSDLKKLCQSKQSQQKDCQRKICEVEQTINTIKMKIADTMNKASELGDEQLVNFLNQHFIG